MYTDNNRKSYENNTKTETGDANYAEVKAKEKGSV